MSIIFFNEYWNFKDETFSGWILRNTLLYAIREQTVCLARDGGNWYPARSVRSPV